MAAVSPRVLVVASLLASAAGAQVDWTQVVNTGAPMAYGGSAFDVQRSRLVAFGGEQGIAQSDFTRELDPVALVWTQLNPAVRPSARRRPAMAYDRARGECVLFGGGSGASTFFGDTWTWNGTTWTQKFPANAPSPRHGSAMAYDDARQVVVLFGGFVASGVDSADTWEWNGTNWSPVATTGPSPRGGHRLAYDEARATTVLYGGFSTPGQLTLGDTWLWNGTSWTSAPGGPGTLCDQLFVYDPWRQRVVLFGGIRFAGPAQIDLALTWEWNGLAWTQRTPAAAPSARSAMACGFSPLGSGRVLCAGGAIGTGTQFGTTWSMQPTTPATVASFGAGCATLSGPVQLDPVSLPYVGGDFVQRLSSPNPANVLGVLAIGVSNTIWNGVPLPLDVGFLGAPGCSVLVSLDVLATVLLLDNGAGTYVWTLPNTPTIAGFSFFTHGVVFDTLGTNPLPIGTSSGRAWTVGLP